MLEVAIVLTLVDPDHVVFQLANYALLDYPIISFVEAIFDLVAEFCIQLKRVISHDLIVIYSLE